MKYELVMDDTIEVDGHILHRIRALKDFDEIKKGDLGGYIEKEINLSQHGHCWIYDNACVYGDAEVRDRALVMNHAHVFGKVKILDSSRVGGYAKIFDNACIRNYSCVFGEAVICDDAFISNDNDYFFTKGIGYSGGLTFFRCISNCNVRVISHGSISQTLQQFEKDILANYVRKEEYVILIAIAKIHFQIRY